MWRHIASGGFGSEVAKSGSGSTTCVYKAGSEVVASLVARCGIVEGCLVGFDFKRGEVYADALLEIL